MRGTGLDISRRAILGGFALTLPALRSAQSDVPRPGLDPDLLRRLRPVHPRISLLEQDLDRLRATTRDQPLARKILFDLEKDADKLLSAPPVEYKIVGPRLLAQSRRALDRISTLALLYRLTGRDPYLRRAVAEMRAAANFKDWNPSHFLDVAEMTHAFALGYDWLYKDLAADEREWIRNAIVTKGLDPALALYNQKAWWTTSHFNWNLVCNGGIGMGALAVADTDPEKSNAALRFALESIPHGLSTYGSDGGWPEGPGYWDYGTRYAVSFFSALETSLGSEFGLSGWRGFDRAGRFRLYTTSPSGKVFNFADATEDAGLAPEMLWLARRFTAPAYAWQEQKQLERSSHPDAYDLIWYQREAKPPGPPALPLDQVFHGVQVATFRSAWDDPNAIFLAVKGGDNKAGHAHLDLGAFVLDAGPVRFATDLGPDDYNLPGYFGRQRWSYYRTRTESHNTLLIDGQNQDVTAEAKIGPQEAAPDLSWVQIDLSKANGAKTKQWMRRIGMVQREAVLIEDTVRSDKALDVLWGMMTDADVSVNGQTATLHKGAWSLAAEIRSPRHAVFDVALVQSAPPQAANANFRKLIVRLGEKVTDLDLNILLTPYRTGTVKPKITAQFPE